jgi:c-di-GMP-binding flagellar brake protein YcgR
LFDLAPASGRIAPDAAAHTMRDPFDIGDALSTLAATSAIVTIYLADDACALARIEAVDPGRSSFTLHLDEHAVLPDGHITLVAVLDGDARLQFDLDLARDLAPGAARLLTLPFPGACLVLNRRAEARLDAPLGASHTARFVLLGKVFELPLCDFSSGGVGMRATPAEALELYVGGDPGGPGGSAPRPAPTGAGAALFWTVAEARPALDSSFPRASHIGQR